MWPGRRPGTSHYRTAFKTSLLLLASPERGYVGSIRARVAAVAPRAVLRRVHINVTASVLRADTEALPAVLGQGRGEPRDGDRSDSVRGSRHSRLVTQAPGTRCEAELGPDRGRVDQLTECPFGVLIGALQYEPDPLALAPQGFDIGLGKRPLLLDAMLFEPDRNCGCVLQILLPADYVEGVGQVHGDIQCLLFVVFLAVIFEVHLTYYILSGTVSIVRSIEHYKRRSNGDLEGARGAGAGARPAARGR